MIRQDLLLGDHGVPSRITPSWWCWPISNDGQQRFQISMGLTLFYYYEESESNLQTPEFEGSESNVLMDYNCSFALALSLVPAAPACSSRFAHSRFAKACPKKGPTFLCAVCWTR